MAMEWISNYESVFTIITTLLSLVIAYASLSLERRQKKIAKQQEFKRKSKADSVLTLVKQHKTFEVVLDQLNIQSVLDKFNSRQYDFVSACSLVQKLSSVNVMGLLHNVYAQLDTCIETLAKHEYEFDPISVSFLEQMMPYYKKDLREVEFDYEALCLWYGTMDLNIALHDKQDTAFWHGEGEKIRSHLLNVLSVYQEIKRIGEMMHLLELSLAGFDENESVKP